MVRPNQSRMQQQRRRRATTRTPAGASDLSGLALVASAIGHIVQASKNKDLEREREQLVAVLRDWQGAYRRLEERARTLRTAYGRVSAQMEKSERERQQWHMRYLACEKELKALNARTQAPPTEKGKR